MQSKRQLWRRRRVVYAIPLAAAAAVALAAFSGLWDRPDETQSAQAPRVVAPLPEDSRPIDSLLTIGVEDVQESISIGRSPTTYERFVFAARNSPRGPATSPMAAMDDAIGLLTADPDSDASQALNSSGLQRGNAERLLMRRLLRSAGAEQIAILRLLAVCGTPRSIPALLRLGRDEAVRDDALATIEHIVGMEGLPQVIGIAKTADLRNAMIRRLLASGSEAALLGYLSLVHDDALGAEALAVAQEAHALPIDDLFTLLDHKTKAVRVSAATVLGSVNGPEVTKLLITRVTEKPSDSSEAWMALLACRGEVAEEFFAYATHRPQLLGHLNSVRARWGHMIP